MKKKEKRELPLLDIPTPVVPIIDPPVPNRAWTEMKVEETEKREKKEQKSKASEKDGAL